MQPPAPAEPRHVPRAARQQQLHVMQHRIATYFRAQAAEEYYYHPFNVTKTTLSGIAAYRSALTLDWLAAEDTRQRELVAAFETEASPYMKPVTSDCISYPRPAQGKVARLMLELLKNLEGDEGVIITDLIQALVRSKLLVLETSVFESEPDLDALVKTPGVMMGEPHTTFPRILAMVWMTVTDPGTVKKAGWCHVNKVSKYLTSGRPVDIAKNMRALEPVVARARFIMEEFIQHVTPLNMMKTSTAENAVPAPKNKANFRAPVDPKKKRPIRTNNNAATLPEVNRRTPPTTTTTVSSNSETFTPTVTFDDDMIPMSACSVPQFCRLILALSLLVVL